MGGINLPPIVRPVFRLPPVGSAGCKRSDSLITTLSCGTLTRVFEFQGVYILKLFVNLIGLFWVLAELTEYRAAAVGSLNRFHIIKSHHQTCVPRIYLIFQLQSLVSYLLLPKEICRCQKLLCLRRLSPSSNTPDLATGESYHLRV